MSDSAYSGIPFVKIPVPIQDTYNARETALLLNVGLNRVYEMAKRERDPLPLRCLPNYARGSFVLRTELLAWMERNAPIQSTSRRKAKRT